MRFKGVFFDAGLTLLTPYPSFHDLFAATLNERGLEVTPEQAQKALDEIAPTFTSVLDHLGTKLWTTSREVSLGFWTSVYSHAFENLGIVDVDGSHAEALYDRFTRFESYRLYDDSIPTLQALKDAGLTLGLISNFEEWLEGMLIEMEVAPLFEVMVISGTEGIEKPDPKIFDLALSRSGVSAEESVYVGDNPTVDARAAEAAGMTGVLLDRDDLHPDFEGNRIRSLDELLSFVEEH